MRDITVKDGMVVCEPFTGEGDPFTLTWHQWEAVFAGRVPSWLQAALKKCRDEEAVRLHQQIAVCEMQLECLKTQLADLQNRARNALDRLVEDVDCFAEAKGT